MAETHEQSVQRSFSQQAPTFEDARFNRVLTVESDWAFAALPLSPDDLVLDVAAGTGIATRGLAPLVRAVVALDATESMLRVGREQALREDLKNVVFQRGDATALPFLDASFSVVVCRYALHHFPSAAAALVEMRRVLAPGGRLAVADLVCDADPQVATLQNELERRRDPSHVRALSGDELLASVRAVGLTVESVETRSVRRPLAPWLEQTETPVGDRAVIERVLGEELSGTGPRTGFQPLLEDGGSTFVQTLSSVVAGGH